MAWALKNPEGFGDYWPKGDYDGWDEQLEDYVHNELSEEEKAKVWDGYRIKKLNFSEKFIKNLGAVMPQESPPGYQTEKSYTKLSSMIKIANRMVVVDESLKGIIEQVEPGIHQFFPFKITMPRGKEYPVHYYILVIRQFIEAYIPTQNTLIRRLRPSDSRFYAKSDTKKIYNQFQLSKKAIGSAHLWRDTRMRSPNIFISDTLQAAIAEAGLKIFRHHQVNEV